MIGPALASGLHGSAALLGICWAVFGVGVITGELAAPFLAQMVTTTLPGTWPCSW
jgi:hypothetical protein